MKISIPLCLVTLALLVTRPEQARAEITYLQLQPDGSQLLRQMNADGSGDAVVPVPFRTMAYPTWSRDGALLAVTATDPATPTHKTRNVFAISSANGAITKLTRYADILSAVNNSRNYTFADHKAFSPDRARMATFSLQAFEGGGAGSNFFPSLEIHSLTTLANTLTLGNESVSDQFHGGEGVDWSPAQNVLATPLQTSAPNLTSGGTSGVTAIFLVEPSDGALDQKRFQQITFPRADVRLGTGNEVPSALAEHDYQPKFSPSGLGLAYIRSFQVQSLLDLTNPTPWTQSLRIRNMNTGADSEVLALPQGFYVTTLGWSEDGSQLAFDIGAQAVGPSGRLSPSARPETNQIYVLNLQNGSLVQLRGNGNSAPAFGPRITAGSGPTALGNIATRMRVGNGENAMIGGFIINGSEPKKVLIRGMGPSLSKVGVPGVLTNPVLNLFQGNTTIATNDDWQQATNTSEIPNGFAPGDARESVIVTTLSPGTYTAVVRGVGGETGVGVVETYDLSQSSNSKLANFSTRGFVETGDNAMIGGFIATGGSSRVLLRAMGPSLQNAGIGNALQDPTLQLIDGNGATVMSNDNWQQAPNTNEIPNGFAPSDARESVIVTTLAAGNYTAVVRGKNNTTGVALVEAYHLQ
jgi:hypothetical protein